MGRDKALVPVDGIAMALRVAAALRDAGASEVVAIGGDAGGLAALGLTVVADRYPGEGPLGGIITAVGVGPFVVTAPCDMPWLAAEHIEPLIDALFADATLEVARSEQHLLAAWRDSAAPALQRAFDDGERAPRRALAELRSVVVALPPGAWSADVDSPNELR